MHTCPFPTGDSYNAARAEAVEGNTGHKQEMLKATILFFTEFTGLAMSGKSKGPQL